MEANDAMKRRVISRGRIKFGNAETGSALRTAA